PASLAGTELDDGWHRSRDHGFWHAAEAEGERVQHFCHRWRSPELVLVRRIKSRERIPRGLHNIARRSDDRFDAVDMHWLGPRCLERGDDLGDGGFIGTLRREIQKRLVDRI